jgi:hypothetical protein
MRVLKVFLFLVFCLNSSAVADSWFTPGHKWAAERLLDMGFQGVVNGPKGVGGFLQGSLEGPTLIFSSNRIDRSLRLLRHLDSLKQGRLIAVFGREITLDQGDYLYKVEFNDDLPPDTIALPTQGPLVELFEVIITDGAGSPALLIASDYLLTLQTRARTSNELVLVDLEDFRELNDGNLAIDLSVTYLKPDLSSRIQDAIQELAQERTTSYGARVVSVSHKASSESGKWPLLRKLLTHYIPASSILQCEQGKSSFSLETFGRPTKPTLTIQASPDLSPETYKALAQVIVGILAIER